MIYACNGAWASEATAKELELRKGIEDAGDVNWYSYGELALEKYDWDTTKVTSALVK
jgi:hypothetical protein